MYVLYCSYGYQLGRFIWSHGPGLTLFCKETRSDRHDQWSVWWMVCNIVNDSWVMCDHLQMHYVDKCVWLTWFTICNTNTSLHAQFQERTWKLVQSKPDQLYRLLWPWCMCMCMWVWWCGVCHIVAMFTALLCYVCTHHDTGGAGHHPVFLSSVPLTGFLSWCMVGLGWCVVGLGWIL